MNIFLQKSSKKQTRTTRILILEQAGLSSKPLSSHRIKKRTQRSSYVFKLIEELCPATIDETIHRQLKFQLTESTKNQLRRIRRKKKEQNPTISDAGVTNSAEYSQIALNRRNWRYTLSLRGLLEYLSESVKERMHLPRIRKIINNMSREDAPFLLYWEYFDSKEFCIPELLIQIAREFKSIIASPYYSDEYLLQEVTERYFFQVSTRFGNMEFFGLLWYQVDMNPEIRSKLKEYRLTISALLKKWYRERYHMFTNAVDDYDNFVWATY